MCEDVASPMGLLQLWVLMSIPMAAMAAKAMPLSVLEGTQNLSSGASEPGAASVTGTEGLRLRRAEREGVSPIPLHLDALLPADHLARQIWEVLGQVDLSGFYQKVKVRVESGGRAATDPKILLALWLYATLEGVNSARKLNRLCVEHLVYIWLCGGVRVNYHSLSDFRSQHGEALEALMSELLAMLACAGLIGFEDVAQDGMRVRASAGAASFRREETLETHLVAAQAFVEQVQRGEASGSEAYAEGDPTLSARSRAAQERATRERRERLEAALEQMPAARAAKVKGKQDKARVSTTDPEARVMKMPDGGYRPAYNFQLAADSAHQVIVGVEVVNSGSDMAQMQPMVEQVKNRCGDLPQNWLVDGGFAQLLAIELVSQMGLCVFAPVQRPKDNTRDPHEPLENDSPAVADWRQRMGTDQAKEIYKRRAATIECVNAQARSRYEVKQLRVRGLPKVRCVALWMAITHNLSILLRHLQQPPNPAAVSSVG